jgi:hypothetical protein
MSWSIVSAISRAGEVRFDGRYVEVRVRGKGRRERALLLWKQVGDAIRAWLAVRGDAACPELFVSAAGKAMARSGFEYVLRKHVRAAAAKCPSLAGRRVSPHVLRHTCALDTLRATGDLRKVALWMGHASQTTTEIYLQADPTEKIQALESVVPPSLRPGRFTPPDRLIHRSRREPCSGHSGEPWRPGPAPSQALHASCDYAEPEAPKTAWLRAPSAFTPHNRVLRITLRDSRRRVRPRWGKRQAFSLCPDRLTPRSRRCSAASCGACAGCFARVSRWRRPMPALPTPSLRRKPIP